MFKDLYLTDLADKIILPNGFDLKIIDEISYRTPSTESSQTILLLVRFGTATKSINDVGTYQQPVMLTCYSEGGSISVAQTALDLFFKTYSHTLFSYSEEENEDSTIYNGVATYVSPTLQKSFNTIGGEKRGTIIMSGLISYSDNLIIGAEYYIDGVEIKPLSYNGAYSSTPVSVQTFGSDLANTKTDSSNATHVISFYMSNNEMCNKLISLSSPTYLGARTATFSKKISSTTITLSCLVVGVLDEYVPANGYIVLTVTLMATT